MTENWIPYEGTALDASSGNVWVADLLWSKVTNSIPAIHNVSKHDRAVADVSGLSKAIKGEELFAGKTVAGLDLSTPVPEWKSELEVVLAPHGLQHGLDLCLQKHVPPSMPREECRSVVSIVKVGRGNC